jgi:plasmid stability protein
MAQVVIRNIDDDVMKRLKERARRDGRSLEQTLREVLADAARPNRAALRDEARRMRESMPPLPPGAPQSEDLVRETRDER